MQGSAFLTIIPTNPALRTVYLHASPLLQINNVTLSSPTERNALLPTPASFAVLNPLQPLPVREPAIDIKSHPEIKRKTWASLSERDEGDLAISVSHGWVRLVETAGAVSLAPIHIQIDYQLVVGGDVVEGIVFRRPGDGGDDMQVPHMFLSPTTYDSARVWTPCVDSLWDRCTWELEFIVPRYLEGGEPQGDDEAFPVMVVASGQLIEQVTHPHDPNKVIFYYMQTTPASVQHISFAAGPFEMLQVPSATAGENQKPMLAFCLPGQLDELAHSTAFLSRAMLYCSTEFGAYPFNAFKMVFVKDPRRASTVSVTMATFSSDLLHPATVIDQAIETRELLSLALIQQWVGVNVIQRTLADTWIIVGLAGYMHSLFIRHLFGNNEYRFRLKKDMDRCVLMDQGDQLPLCMPGTIDPPSAKDMSFMSLKAPLVLHILDRYIAKSGTSLGLGPVLPRIFMASLSDDLPGNSLSTNSFFRFCRRASNMDFLSFQDMWVYGSGCPHITIKTNFIRKKFLVEFAVQQQQPALAAAEGLDAKSKEKFLASKRPTPFFEGSLTVRIHEADGAPFEHLVDLKQNFKVFPLPFNTKYKRTRRSGHVAARFSKLQETLAQADDNDVEQAEQLRNADRTEVFAYPPWEEEEERMRWRVHDWSEEEAGAMLGEGGGYEWIRVDPELEWLATFDIQEKPWYWISQLQGDRDVVAQLQAIQRMTQFPSPVIASELARTVLVENYFYRVRMEAARALVAYNTGEADYMGLFLLFKLFQTFYCHPSDDEDPESTTCRPLPNDFSNFANYFLKKSIVTALSELRDPATRMVWRNVRQCLLDLLRLNDNSENEYSDSHYIATLISAIGGAFSAGANVSNNLITEEEREIDRQLLKEATDANERAITVDRLVPSYRNLVTQAGLQAQLKSIMVGQRTNDPRIFLSYTREGNYEPLRMLAFDCLLLCRPPGRSQALAQYLFDVIRNDYSLTVRRHVARTFSESIIMTLAVGEVYMAAQPGVIEINPDQSVEQRSKEQEAEHLKIVKALRKDYASKGELKQLVQTALFDAYEGRDSETLFALLKAAEVMSASTSEPKPGVLITLAPTPVAEVPPAPPSAKIRLSLGTPTEVKTEPEAFPLPRMPSPAPASAPIKLVLNSAQPPKEKKKKKNVPKAQSKGLSDTDFKTITVVLQKLLADKRSLLFRQPVDPIRDNAPDYPSIVTTPMDLSTVRAKLDNGMYTSRKEFEDDIRLLVSNCYLYNPHGSPVRKSGEAFEKYFKSVWTKTENTLKSTSAGQPASPAKHSALPRLVVPGAGPSTGLMPPPPVPPSAASAGGAPMKIKLKQNKSVTIDAPPSPVLSSSSMAPPPFPKKAASGGASSSAREKGKGKKRRESGDSSALDDLLGAEVDAMDRAQGKGGDMFEELLDPSPPPLKKIKLSTKAAAPASKAQASSPKPPGPSIKFSAPSAKVRASPSSASPERERERDRDRERDRERERDRDRDRDRERERDRERDARPSKKAKTKDKDRGDREPPIKIKEPSAKVRMSSEPHEPVEAYKPRERVDRADSASKSRVPSESSKTRPAESARSRTPVESSRSKTPTDLPKSKLSSKTKPSEPSSKIKISDPSKSRYSETSSKSRASESSKSRASESSKTKASGESSKSRIFSDPRPPSDAYRPREMSRELSRDMTREMSREMSRELSRGVSRDLSRSNSPVKMTTPPVPRFEPPPPVTLAPPPISVPALAPEPVFPAAPLAYAPPQWPKPPSDLPATKGNSMPLRIKRSKQLIQALTKDLNAVYFLKPVDPIRDGCPTYYDEIRHPSDYQTITKNIDQKKYKTMGELARDIELIFANCRQFNPPGAITDMAAANEALYWKEWARAVSPKLTSDERRAMVSVVNRALKDNVSLIFREPVDPVQLGIPQYFDIIPREDARDLSLIKTKLEKNVYSTARQVDKDVDLMLENCRMFNGEGPITDLANAFAKWWKGQRDKMDVV